MTVTSVADRVVIVTPGSSNPFTQGATTVHSDHLWVTSFRNPALHNYISGDGPTDDGDFLNVLEGKTTDWTATIPISDVSEYVTNFLADAGGRWQLKGRTAYWERTTDGGTTWLLRRKGYVTDVQVARAQEVVISIGGDRRRERFTPVARLSQYIDPSVGVFRPTTLVGNPVYGGVPGRQSDLGHTLVTVVDNFAGNGGWVAVRPPSGLWWHPTVMALGQNQLNLGARRFYTDGPVTYHDVGDFALRGRFKNLRAQVFDPATGSEIDGPRGLWGVRGDTGNGFLAPIPLMAEGNRVFLNWQDPDIDTLAPVGTQFLLVIYPTEPSEEFPLFATGHPALLMAEALAAIGLTVDISSYAAARVAIGEDYWYTTAITDPKQSIEAWVNEVGQAFGLAVVPGPDDGSRRLIATREPVMLTDALATITDDDIRGFGSVATFADRDPARRNVVRSTIRRWIRWPSIPGASITVDPSDPQNPAKGTLPGRPWSGLESFDAPTEVLYSSDGFADDKDIYGEQAIDLPFRGSPEISYHGLAPNPAPLNALDFIHAIAHRLFDKYARGAPEYGLTKAGQLPAGVGLGDIIQNSTSYQPNALPSQSPASQRGGDRPVRIIGLTRERVGDVLTCLDEGAGLPLVVAFDISDVQDAGGPGPGEYALSVTVTGGIALAAAGALVDIYLAFSNSASSPPTDRGVRAKTLDMRNLTDDDVSDHIGGIPQGVVPWVRAEAWVPGGQRSATTEWWCINGPVSGGPGPVTPPGPAGAISSLTFPNVDAQWATAQWTNTDTANPVLFQYRVDGTTLWTTHQLNAGTTQMTMAPLQPDTDYEVEVTLISSPGGVPVGTLLTDTFTTLTLGAGTPVLLHTPTRPRAYAGVDPDQGHLFPQSDAVGIMVTIEDIPFAHLIEFEMATETAVGSGVVGSWSAQQTKAAVYGDMHATWYVPNDGRLRYFRARANEPTYGPSNWTPIVSAMPFTFQSYVVDDEEDLIDGGTFALTGPSVLDGGAFTDTYSGPPVDGGDL